MLGSAPEASTQIPDSNQSTPIPTCGNLSNNSEPNLLQTLVDERDCEQNNVNEDEDEDADFNPFLKETQYVEASSSLSSEVEGLDTDVSDSGMKRSPSLLNNSMENHLERGYDSNAVDEVEHEDEIVMQAADPLEETSGKQFGPTHNEVVRKKLLSVSKSDNGLLYGRENVVSEMTDVLRDVDSGKSVVDIDTEDAICMRTRARYSLASFTLDELETFLQETDEEDDLHNVDEEEEYRKFLAAVLRGDDSENLQGNINVDDEDEDNDADFELELEEALESDPDEIEERRRSRRNLSRRGRYEHNSKFSLRVNKPLRPILPIAPVGSFPSFDGNHFVPNISPHCLSTMHNGFIGGFTPHQIGQLYCLIHEHVQLLVQVFSLSVFDPAKRHIAAEVKELMLELLKKYDQVLTWKSHPYPRFCLFPPYICSSVSNDFDKMFPINGQCESNNDKPSERVSLSNCRSELISIEQPSTSPVLECDLRQTIGSTPWSPSICDAIFTVIDVAPLRLVGNYVDNVSSAILAIEQYQVEPGFESHLEKEPLFPLHNSLCFTETDGREEIRTTSLELSRVHSSASGKAMPKKTMAAMLVEKAKKQSVALVPKEIAELAQRFRPLFNWALYPHKPPPASIANRVLFTDSEDELLASGLMEYNSDWKSIQQRFLPSKSKHQIFVRQKNRASSKAPENPIKAVRRMKNSPLTSDEISRIELGLTKFKLDWISIWRFFVPYRDPSLLPRLWRIACGTQKSYKSDANKKAKRRLYELRKRALRSASTLQSSSDKEDNDTDVVEEITGGDNCMATEDEAYVHEAFFEDWRPDNCVSVNYPAYRMADVGIPQSSQHKNVSGSRQVQLQSPVCPATSRSSKSEVILRPYRARGPKSAHMVKLAPGLPPVNLPPSVRVMSQSVFKSSQAVFRGKFSKNSSGFSGNAAVNEVSRHVMVAKSGVDCSVKSGNITQNSMKVTFPSQQSNSDKCVMDAQGDTDLQMHPLLFQAPQDGLLPYYPQSCSTGRTTHLSSFSGNKTQLNLSLFHNSRYSRDAGKSSKHPGEGSTSGVDFHPLLQRTDNLRVSSVSTKDESPNPLCKISVNDSLSTSGVKISNSCGTASGLDLDIHLSFTSTNQETVQNRDMVQLDADRLVQDLVVSGIEKSQCSKDTSKESCSAADESSFKLGSEQIVLVTPQNIRKNAYDDMRDDSFPGIIMEQEELSDSDEEFGENVEFECEEMADSEEDNNTSDSEQFEFNEKSEGDRMSADIDGCEGLNASDDCGGIANPNFSLNPSSCMSASPHSISGNVSSKHDLVPFGESQILLRSQEYPELSEKNPVTGFTPKHASAEQEYVDTGLSNSLQSTSSKHFWGPISNPSFGNADQDCGELCSWDTRKRTSNKRSCQPPLDLCITCADQDQLGVSSPKTWQRSPSKRSRRPTSIMGTTRGEVDLDLNVHKSKNGNKD